MPKIEAHIRKKIVSHKKVYFVKSFMAYRFVLHHRSLLELINFSSYVFLESNIELVDSCKWPLFSVDKKLRVSYITTSNSWCAHATDKNILCCVWILTFVETHTTSFFRQSFVFQKSFKMAINSRFESVSIDEVNVFLSLKRNKNMVNMTNSDIIYESLLKIKR